MHRHLTADHFRNADHLGFDDLARRAVGLGDHLRLAHLAAGRVRHFAGADLLRHRAGRVRNLLGDGFARPRAGCVRNLLGNGLAGPGAGRVRHFLGDGLTGPGAGRIGNLFLNCVLFPADARVRNLLYVAFGNAAADSVGLLAVMNFLNHTSAGDGSHFGAGYPTLAAHRTAGLFADGTAAARLVAAAAAAGVPFPGSRIANATLYDRSGNLFRFGNPFARAEWDFLGFADGLARRVADVAIAGLSFRAVAGTGHFAILRLTDRLAHCAADRAIAGLHTGFADRAADIAIAGLNAWFADRATDIAVAGLNARLTDRAANVAVASLVDRLAHRVTFVAIAGLTNGSRASDGHLFRTLLVDGAAAIHSLLFIDCFANRLIAGSAAALCGAVVTARCARRRRTTLVTGGPAIGGFNSCVRCESQHAREDDPGSVSHRSVP